MSAASLARRRRRRRNGHGSHGAGNGSGNGSGNGGRRNRLLALLGGLALLLLIVGGAAAGAGVLIAVNRYNEFVKTVVPPEELLSQLPRGGARFYDRNGTLLYEFVDELSGLRRPVPLADISQSMIEATIATEDQAFYDHIGINIRGLARAAWENFSPLGGALFEGSGGSSITQQLAKNVYIPREERAERTAERKLKEAAIAIELTRDYTKDEVLEWYLNSISYGGIYVGVEAAAEGYFGKSANELALAEAALLAGIPQSPGLYDPYQNLDADGNVSGFAKTRQRGVLNLMVRAGYITQDRADKAFAEELKLRTGRFDIEAPHFVLGRVAREIEARFGPRALYEDGLEVVTTLDLPLQKRAEEILERWIAENEELTDGHNGALYAIDARTGEVLVYVGSRDYFRDDIEGRNDNIISVNSPGSTLKPFTYITAFMQGWSTGTGIIDMPFAMIDAATGEPFRPRNFNTASCEVKSDCKFQGVVAANRALGNSLNTPAFKTILFGGVKNTVQVLKEVGFTTFDNPLGYGPALTLGGADVTLEDLTFAYSVLANEGVMRGQSVVVPFDPGERTVEPVALLSVTDADGNSLYRFEKPVDRRVIASNFAYLATSVISDGDNQCITWSCGALELPDGRTSAKKTGTSEPFEYEDGTLRREIGDTWTVGYTPDLVAGVWAGNADNSPMVNIVSTTISWRTWRDFMAYAVDYLELPPKEFERPSGVVERELCWPSGRLPSDLCPRVNRYTGLFAEDVLPRTPEELTAMQDDWWQMVQIDTRSGLLAAPETPAAFVANDLRLVLPRDELYVVPAAGGAGARQPELWKGFRDWVSLHGLVGLIAPLEEPEDGATPEQLVAITMPAEAQTVAGPLPIVGRALSPAFERYVVEWGRGSQPPLWIRIQESSRPVAVGVLAVWDTLTVPNGPYTVRVVVTDLERGDLTYTVPLNVDNGDRAPTADLAPFAVIQGPLDGSVVSGTVKVSGAAVSGDLLEVVIEVGAGLAPGVWTQIARSEQPVVGELARWDTTGFADGTYTLRLRVRDRRLGSTELSALVTVRNAPDDATPQ